MSSVYIVQQGGCLHLDSIWENLSRAEARKTELNAGAGWPDYIVTEVDLNAVIEQTE